MKDKEERDRRRAYQEWMAERTQRKQLRVSPRDQTFRYFAFFNVELRPTSITEDTWEIYITAFGTYFLRRFFKGAEKAQTAYDAINHETECKTLLGRGYKFV